jgi:hypothetical protein
VYAAVQFLRSKKMMVYRVSGDQHRIGSSLVTSRELIALAAAVKRGEAAVDDYPYEEVPKFLRIWRPRKRTI